MPPHYAAYREWVERGAHGEMSYLREHLELKVHPNRLLEGCKSVIAVALNYNQQNLPALGKPKIARYALGRDYHKVLRKKLLKLQERIEAVSPGGSYRVCVDSAPLMERDFAHLAGLGWFGKNTCLIDSKRGSWFVLGFLLTTLEIEPDKPAIGGCGTCTNCVDACPTGAIVFEEGHWQIVGHRCISYLTIEKRGELEPELAAKLSGWTFGCDICQEVCPFNDPRPSQPLRGALTTEADFQKKRAWPSLAEFADLSRKDWDALTQGSPVRRAGFEGLKRNARNNLGQS